MCSITGYTDEDLSGKNFATLMVDKNQSIDVFNTTPENEQNETSFQIIKKNGIKKHIGIRPALMIDEDGQKTGYRTFVRDIDDQKKHEEKLIFLAYHDALTGLNNRKAFYEHLAQCLKTAKRNQTKMAVMFIDIDKFKQVNDTLGHKIGDELLKTISQRLSDNLRETDFISRIGGDEFTIVMTDSTSFHPGKLAKRILGAIRFPYDFNNHTIDYVSASIGISLFPNDGQNIEALVKISDQAMYEAKNSAIALSFFKIAPKRQLKYQLMLQSISKRILFRSKPDAGAIYFNGRKFSPLNEVLMSSRDIFLPKSYQLSHHQASLVAHKPLGMDMIGPGFLWEKAGSHLSIFPDATDAYFSFKNSARSRLGAVLPEIMLTFKKKGALFHQVDIKMAHKAT